jgi:hypothetical protein
MPRYIHDRITVRLAKSGAAPDGFTWEGRRYAVRSVDACWKAVGPWWDGDGERTYFRVVAICEEAWIANCELRNANCKLEGEDDRRPTTDHRPPTTDDRRLMTGAGVYELCYDHEGERWFLETVVD